MRELAATFVLFVALALGFFFGWQLRSGKASLDVIQPPAVVRTVPAPFRRATLEDVRRAWKIHGRLVCHVEAR